MRYCFGIYQKVNIGIIEFSGVINIGIDVKVVEILVWIEVVFVSYLNCFVIFYNQCIEFNVKVWIEIIFNVCININEE